MSRIINVTMALLLVGCSGVQVRTTPAPGAQMARLRTFAFVTPVDASSQAARLAASPAGQQIEQELSRDLIAKGYAPAAENTRPDFLVAYRASLRDRTEVHTWAGAPGPWGWGWGWGWGGAAWGGPDVTVQQYTEGTLILDFVDPSSQRVLWRGTATGVVSDPANPDLGKLAKAVDKLADRVPATGVATTGNGPM